MAWIGDNSSSASRAVAGWVKLHGGCGSGDSEGHEAEKVVDSDHFELMDGVCFGRWVDIDAEVL